MSHLEDTPQTSESSVPTESTPVEQQDTEPQVINEEPQMTSENEETQQQQTPSLNESPDTSEGDACENAADDLSEQFEKHMKMVEEAHGEFLQKLKQKRQKHDCCHKLDATQKKLSDLLQKLDAARQSAESLLHN